MPTRFTCTINTSNTDGETRRSESQAVNDLLEQIQNHLGSGAKVSNASLRDRNGNIVGSWSYTPTAAQ